MKLLTQALVGAFSLAGGCCAVGVPVALSISKKSTRRNIELVKCSTEVEGIQRTSVSFGDTSHHSLCYSLSSSDDEEGGEAEDGEPSSGSLSSELVDLLRETWNGWTGSWPSGEYSNWKVSCGTGTSGWRLSSLDARKRVLGNCKLESGMSATERDSSTNFLEIRSGESGKHNTQLKVCSQGQECWSDSFDGQNVREFKTPVNNFWNSINFYENSDGQIKK
ncbi:hypothetical protein [Candidatus Mycoplasma haematominutum]|uniref:Lipoprotein n=1 Tax=Candidatus Mycoplasma haematominutum 'Birmingham 1' TaxID=1116213 RepID=G8C3N8_9MOLU|nr:hypothetical protein [Candidatus Mycoplasma haematominutum]CCE66936.1 hypothetical protein MHM_04180 [Candidatus Mycoplasma haematominutum 'Birmingham 1']